MIWVSIHLSLRITSVYRACSHCIVGHITQRGLFLLFQKPRACGVCSFCAIAYGQYIFKTAAIIWLIIVMSTTGVFRLVRNTYVVYGCENSIQVGCIAIGAGARSGVDSRVQKDNKQQASVY
jgi:hypothetical protein